MVLIFFFQGQDLKADESLGAKPKSCSTPKPTPASAASSSGASGSSGDKFNDFWETLLRLDTQISASKADKGKGKGVARSLSGAGGSGSSSLNVDDPSADGVQGGAGASPEATFQASAFGQVSRNSIIKKTINDCNVKNLCSRSS